MTFRKLTRTLRRWNVPYGYTLSMKVTQGGAWVVLTNRYRPETRGGGIVGGTPAQVAETLYRMLESAR